MTTDTDPHIGDWYQIPAGEAFEIVARDDDDNTLELQYYDGTIEELDREAWEMLHPEPVEPPEDWRGSLDVSPEDLESLDEGTAGGRDWMVQLEGIDALTR
ncbi:MAG TPA: hypothetical protein ENJ79_07115 [Gammaproteobacteria bacterium]|nr:hypothetical protein [Gammaproteobacteria bacterium]